MINIKLPQLSWPGQQLDAIYKLLQSTPELGFLYKESLKSHIRENTTRGTLWAAYEGDELIGVATIGSRRQYPHLARHGEIAVVKKHRRRRIATALYFVQMLQGIIEGRRQVEDTIIPSLSPWMRGPTDCEGVGFLPSLQYTLHGVLPQRTGAFRDIELWGKMTTEIDIFLERIPESSYELPHTEKVDATFAKNIKTYRNNEANELANELEERREWLLSTFNIIEISSKQKGGLL